MQKSEEAFDLRLAGECANAFSRSTGLGCLVDGVDGRIYGQYGYCSANCRVCQMANQSQEDCRGTHLYGMREAERFGGKYIYFCTMGLAFLVSPIVGESSAVAKITAGPFLMVDRLDYAACDLVERHGLSPRAVEEVLREIERVPYITPADATSLSTLLFMCVGFMNNVASYGGMLRAQRADYLQSQISSYIIALKGNGAPPSYPFEAEQSMVQAILRGDRESAQGGLNEVLGGVMFSSGSNFRWIRARCYELMVVISRAAVQSGADPDSILGLNDEYFDLVPRCQNIMDLSMELSEALRRYMGTSFAQGASPHSDAVRRAIRFVRMRCSQRITLEDAARDVFLSPTYLSRVFKQETGVSFTRFLNSVRVEKSKRLLDMTEMRLTDVASACGFEDQSYFTKVFRSLAGVTPQAYRRRDAVKEAPKGRATSQHIPTIP